ncbi:S4 domain-containing protein [Halomonas sp. A11-A]|jgi:hypothetical protein|nr:S4 domain-containing protein [Halomonas sp. A11-A]
MAQTLSKRINKYISESGMCSRREADRYIEQGNVRIDGRRQARWHPETRGSGGQGRALLGARPQGRRGRQAARQKKEVAIPPSTESHHERCPSPKPRRGP